MRGLCKREEAKATPEQPAGKREDERQFERAEEEVDLTKAKPQTGELAVSRLTESTRRETVLTRRESEPEAGKKRRAAEALTEAERNLLEASRASLCPVKRAKETDHSDSRPLDTLASLIKPAESKSKAERSAS